MVRPLRVLVVDDHKDTREMLGFVLDLQGYDVRVAGDGAVAIEVAAGFRPHVAFLDLGLPNGDGCELFLALRALPGLADVRGVAITGWTREEDRRRTLAAGFRWHFLKPVPLERVLAVLAEVAREIDEGVPPAGMH